MATIQAANDHADLLVEPEQHCGCRDDAQGAADEPNTVIARRTNQRGGLAAGSSGQVLSQVHDRQQADARRLE